MTTENAKQTTEMNTNKHKSLISYLFKDLGMEILTSQKKKKRKQRKRKISQKLIFQRTKAVIKGSAVMS